MSTANQFLGLAVDPVVLGSTLDSFGGSPTYEVPTIYLPVISANASPGYTNLSRGNEAGRGRGNPPATPFRAMPTLTFTCRLYPSIAAFLLPKTWGGAIVATGTAPAAITSKVTVATSALPAMQALLVRATQMDRFTGLWVDTLELNVPADEDPTLTVTMRALWHKHYTSAGLPTPTLTTENPYRTVTLASKIGASSTPIACVGDMSLSYNNNLVTDTKQIYCKNENLETANVAGKYATRQYPGRHKLGDNQLTGRIGFGTERVDIEDRLRLATADKLVFELGGDPISPATTPAADELLRLTLPTSQITGGGASELTDERDPDSDYEFEGLIDPATGATPFVELVRKTAVA